MKVRTIRRHDNTYGDAYTKNPGKLYDHPNPRVLIDGGYLEAVDGKNSSKNGGPSRIGGGSKAATEGHGEVGSSTDSN